MSNLQYYYKYKAKGLCTRCGTNKPTITSLKCVKCSLLCSNISKQIRKVRKENKKCITCLRPTYKGRTRCKYHLVYSIASSAMCDTKYTDVLLDLLKVQKNRCQLCNRHIDIGDNAELDHIKPKKYFPQLKSSITNVRWLCHNCNVVKHTNY